MPNSSEGPAAANPAATPALRGWPRKYATDAERSRAYRVRVKGRKAALAARAASGQPVPSLFPDPDRAAAAIQVLDSLLNGDEQKQRKAWKDLEEVLGEKRPSYRKLFP